MEKATNVVNLVRFMRGRSVTPSKRRTEGPAAPVKQGTFSAFQDMSSEQNKIIEEKNKLAQELTATKEELSASLHMQKIITKDRNDLQEQLKQNSYNPLVFASSKTREEFWKTLEGYTDRTTIERVEDLREELHESQKLCANLQGKIDQLQTEAQDAHTLRQRNTLLQNQLTEIEDKYAALEQKYSESKARITSLKQRLKQVQDNQGEQDRKVQEMATMLDKRIQESEVEKGEIRKTLDKMQKSKKKQKTNNEIHKISADCDISHLFLRLRSVSPVSDKYFEILQLLLDLLKSEKLQTPEEELLRKKDSILNQLMANYKFILAAMKSKKEGTLKTALDLIVTIGHVEEHADEIVSSGAATCIIEGTKKHSKLRQYHLAFVARLSDLSVKFCDILANRNMATWLLEYLEQNKKGPPSISDSVTHAMIIVKNLLFSGFCYLEFSNDQSIELWSEILKIDKMDTTIETLYAILTISDQDENRDKLSEFGVFHLIIEFLKRAYNDAHQELLEACVASLAHFSKDRPRRILLNNCPFDLVKLLSYCIDVDSGCVSSTRLAACTIITQMMQDIETRKEDLIRSGLVGSLIKGLRDEEDTIKAECARLLGVLGEVVDSYPEVFRSSIRPLSMVLSSNDAKLVLRVINTLQVLARERKLHSTFLGQGVVRYLNNLIRLDPSQVNEKVLVDGARLYVALACDDNIRNEILNQDLLEPMLGLFFVDDHMVRVAWFDLMKEICAYPDVRTRLEHTDRAFEIIRRAIDLTTVEYAGQMVALIRILVISEGIIDQLMKYSDRLWNFFLLVKDVADEMAMVFILQSFGLISKSESGIAKMKKNREILAMVIMSLLHPSKTVQNEAAFQIRAFLDLEQLSPALMDLPIYQYITQYYKQCDAYGKALAVELMKRVQPNEKKGWNKFNNISEAGRSVPTQQEATQQEASEHEEERQEAAEEEKQDDGPEEENKQE